MKKPHTTLRLLLLISFVFSFSTLFAEDLDELETRCYARAAEFSALNNRDSAFLYLDSLVSLCGHYDPELYPILLSQPSFRALHLDFRWSQLVYRLKKARREELDKIQMNCPQKSTETNVEAGVSYYRLNANLDVKSKKLQVDGTLSLDFHHQPFIDLALWQFSDIREISENGVAMRYEFTSEQAFQWMEQAKCLRIYRGSVDCSDIHVAYTARLDSLNTWMASCDDDFVQLSMYMAWFPCNPDGPLFTGAVKFGINERYEVTASGKVSKEGNQWLIQQPYPGFDFEIIASPNLKRLTTKAGNKKLEIDYLSMSTQDLDLIASACNEIINFYDDTFCVEPNADELKIVLSPLNIGGISRRNFVVTGASCFSESLYGLMAHEIGHLWWHNAPTNSWLDWMNESFAEYSKLQTLRKHYGEQVFQDYIEAYRERSYRTCPIKGLDREAPNADIIFYQKGAVILCDMQTYLGDDRFYKWLQTLLKNRVASHTQLMQVTSSVLTRQWSDWLESRLSE